VLKVPPRPTFGPSVISMSTGTLASGSSFAVTVTVNMCGVLMVFEAKSGSIQQIGVARAVGEGVIDGDAVAFGVGVGVRPVGVRVGPPPPVHVTFCKAPHPLGGRCW
jgi:hypothetical protein